jgi:hypothetical protein
MVATAEGGVAPRGKPCAYSACNNWFVHHVTDANKRYCSRRCKRRDGNKRWVKRRKLLDAGTRESTTVTEDGQG